MDVIDNHAPQKSQIVTVRADKPWRTVEQSQEKKIRRKYEWKYKQSKLTVDKLHEQWTEYDALLNSTKQDYIKNKIENAEPSKDAFKVCDKFLNPELKAILQPRCCAQSPANTFVNYFNEKIELIRNNLET